MKRSSTSERLKQIMGERNLRQVDILNAASPYCKRYGIKLGKNDLSQKEKETFARKQDKPCVE